MILNKYSFGNGDRFAHEGKAQLKASIIARNEGVTITPVWNKSFREHQTVKSTPEDVRIEANDAVESLGWKGQYLIDADHINLSNVDSFIDSSDFFTLDVADYIGKPASEEEINLFVEKFSNYVGEWKVPGIKEPFTISKKFLEQIALDFLFAINEAKQIYNYIADKKGVDGFITEVSMDEVMNPQTPVELFFILAAISDAGIPTQTIAPKFTGRFNKGVDYVGDINKFSKEFEEDILIIKLAIKEFGLPENLKLSVHSGSDKFSIYDPINSIIKKHDAGLHIKTAGTTWLEELISLAEVGDNGLEIAKNIYSQALNRYDELTGPYSTVIDIEYNNLPTMETVNDWDGKKFADTLRHDQGNPSYDPEFRQLLHCAYKIAAELGEEFTNALNQYSNEIEKNVTQNLYERHIKPIFIGK